MSDEREESQERDERNWSQGYKTALVGLLQELIHRIGIKEPEVAHLKWVDERQRTVNALRSICEDYGDNDWDDNLFLADVIEKHLHRHLGE